MNSRFPRKNHSIDSLAALLLFAMYVLFLLFLMLFGAGGLAGIYLILGTCYFFEVSGFFMVVLVVLAIACYAMSLGPITWVLLAEIFPNRVRAVAMATCTFALWVGSFTLTYTFPLLNNFLGSSGTFWIYAVICAVGYLLFFRALPETKGKSLEALEKDLLKVPEYDDKKLQPYVEESINFIEQEIVFQKGMIKDEN